MNENIGQPIYHLIAILEDAKKGYLNAAEKIKDEVLSLLLENFGYQKSRYINELRHVVNQLGVNSSIDHFTLSLLHRTWMDLKNTFKFGQKEAVIEACIRAEETALQNYNMAIGEIKEDDEIKTVLLQQANGIKTALNTIKEYTARIR